jgi:hypothetical protein
MTAKTTKRILPDLATAKRMAELEAKLAATEASLEKATKSAIKVGNKGGVSVYGFGRFPVTLYQTQWAQLFDMVPEIKAFIKANESKLARKE